MNLTYRPLGHDWPGKRTPASQRHDSRFKRAGRFVEGQGYQGGGRMPWNGTLTLLDRELRELGAKELILQLDLSESDIRLDGLPRANAKPEDPAVIISFESKHGPLRYFCDQFTDWHDNVRAIALGLEALRKVDRYGITRKGQQYAGWKALPPSSGQVEGVESRFAGPDDAAEFMLAKAIGRMPNDQQIEELVAAPVSGWFQEIYRRAAKRCHPDTGGTRDDWDALVEARAVLEKAA